VTLTDARAVRRVGPLDPPYDITGYTLSFQMGVQVDKIDGPLDSRLRTEPVDVAEPPRVRRQPLDRRQVQEERRHGPGGNLFRVRCLCKSFL
jgi:hypothetical protein